MERVIFLNPKRWWECPNCDLKDVTFEAEIHSRFHSCAGLKGLTAPMVPAGTRAKIYAKEREDYVGNETVQTDAEGRPIMSVMTERDDGEDCTVYAPMVGARWEG